MNPEQIIIYTENISTMNKLPVVKQAKKQNIQVYLISSQQEAQKISLLAESCILLTDAADGNDMAKKLCIPYLGLYQPNIPSCYPDAISLFENPVTLTLRYLSIQWEQAMNYPATIAIAPDLTIRELAKKDISTLYNIYQNPLNTAFIPSITNTLEETIIQHEHYIINYYHFFQYGLWGIFLPDGTLIGHAGIQNINFSKLMQSSIPFHKNKTYLEICYLIDFPYQKQGFAHKAILEIMRYAQTELSIQYLYAFIPKKNIRSVKLAMDFSMKKIGHCCYMGLDCDIFYSKKLSEWLPLYEKEQKRIYTAQSLRIKAEKKPVQSVYKKLYTRKKRI